MLSGCTKISKSDKNLIVITSDGEIPVVTQTAVERYVPSRSFGVVPKTPIPLETESATVTEFEDRQEAEYQGLAGLKLSDEIDGYSGYGYATGFKERSKLNFSVNAPVDGHYNITVAFYGLKSDAKGQVIVNNIVVGDFTPTAPNKYLTATFFEIYLESGFNDIIIMSLNGDMNIDYIEVTDSALTEIKNITPTLSNPNASTEAKDLMKYLCDNYGKKVITGQYVSSEKNLELDLLKKETTQYPAIRFGDMGEYTFKTDCKEVESALDWALGGGGIVGEMWYWVNPAEAGTPYTSDFKLANAVTDTDISQYTSDEIEALYAENKISKEAYLIISDIDIISEKMYKFRDNNVPVLWRPLHEASGDWFWWGADKDAYLWLWNLMYKRMTEYHKLNNLIWIWNGQSKNFIVPSNQYDIGSADIYLRNETEFSSRSVLFKWLNRTTSQQKLLAVSECGDLPNINDMFRDNAVWSFFGLWYGEYISTDGYTLSPAYNSLEEFNAVYNSEKSITLYDYVNR
ncbi:MAG: hypothetical protein LBM93_04605 [Oscillospiraceae bacterium]|jgi:mannan endo-1,4-beta-mannosidase|nr:hypothetical protein [Oscillospiraceae bacterium]